MPISEKTIESKLNQEITFLLQEEITYDEFLKNTMLIIGDIKTGIPYSLFNLIQITPHLPEVTGQNFWTFQQSPCIDIKWNLLIL